MMWLTVVVRLAPLVLNLGGQEVLEARCRSGAVEAWDAKRARMIPLAADGASNRSIADKVGLHHDQVGVWRERYGQLGSAVLVGRGTSRF